jgi:hypothetical protein
MAATAPAVREETPITLPAEVQKLELAPAEAPKLELSPAAEPATELSPDVMNRVDTLSKMIDQYYVSIPTRLKSSPEAQRRCLTYLAQAEAELVPQPSRSQLIEARLNLARIEIELTRARSVSLSVTVIIGILYLFAMVFGIAFATGLLRAGITAADMNKLLLLGVPGPIWMWSVIGSLTSMLLRAGSTHFADFGEAIRWLLFRPVVGLVMGVLTYLIVATGLLVFAGSSDTRAPELVWLIAFAGSFSNTLSIHLLQKLLGSFQTAEASSTPKQAPAEAAAHTKK